MTHRDTTTMSVDGLQVTTAPAGVSSDADLGEALVARLCHDLASPLGAIGNGVELLQMLAETASPELELVNASVQQATGRLRLYRLAFGPAHSTQMTGVAEMRDLLRSHDESARFWTDLTIQRDLPRTHFKLILLGVLCMETALAWGGSVQIAETGSGYVLRTTAERLREDPALWAALDDGTGATAVTAANVQFRLLSQASRDYGFRLSCHQDAQSITLHLDHLIG